MTTRWVLDANVFMRAQDDGVFDEMVKAAAIANAVVPKAVRDEIAGAGGRKPAPRFAPFGKAIDDSSIDVPDIALGSPEAATYAQIRSSLTGTGNEGECVCIAMAAHSQKWMFVTNDAKAAFLGLTHLDGRVLTIPSFLIRLVEEGQLCSEHAVAIMNGSIAPLKPCWWDTRFQQLNSRKLPEPRTT